MTRFYYSSYSSTDWLSPKVVLVDAMLLLQNIEDLRI